MAASARTRARYFGSTPACARRVEGVEVLGEARRRVRFLAADAPILVGVELGEEAGVAVARAAVGLVEGMQLFHGDLAVVVRIDGVELLEHARQRLRLGTADHAVAIGVGGLETLEHGAALRAAGIAGHDQRGGRAEREGGEDCDCLHGCSFWISRRAT
jgi:hypothetical protein